MNRKLFELIIGGLISIQHPRLQELTLAVGQTATLTVDREVYEFEITDIEGDTIIGRRLNIAGRKTNITFKAQTIE